MTPEQLTPAEKLEWGLGMTGLGMGMVFVMLAILMVCLMAMPLIDKFSRSAQADGTDVAAPAPVLAAPAAAVAAPVQPADLPAAELAAIAIAIHTAQGQDDATSLVANQSGIELPTSRWVAVGRSLNSQSWHRS